MLASAAQLAVRAAWPATAARILPLLAAAAAARAPGAAAVAKPLLRAAVEASSPSMVRLVLSCEGLLGAATDVVSADGLTNLHLAASLPDGGACLEALTMDGAACLALFSLPAPPSGRPLAHCLPPGSAWLVPRLRKRLANAVQAARVAAAQAEAAHGRGSAGAAAELAARVAVLRAEVAGVEVGASQPMRRVLRSSIPEAVPQPDQTHGQEASLLAALLHHYATLRSTSGKLAPLAPLAVRTGQAVVLCWGARPQAGGERPQPAPQSSELRASFHGDELPLRSLTRGVAWRAPSQPGVATFERRSELQLFGAQRPVLVAADAAIVREVCAALKPGEAHGEMLVLALGLALRHDARCTTEMLACACADAVVLRMPACAEALGRALRHLAEAGSHSEEAAAAAALLPGSSTTLLHVAADDARCCAAVLRAGGPHFILGAACSADAYGTTPLHIAAAACPAAAARLRGSHPSAAAVWMSLPDAAGCTPVKLAANAAADARLREDLYRAWVGHGLHNSVQTWLWIIIGLTFATISVLKAQSSHSQALVAEVVALAAAAPSASVWELLSEEQARAMSTWMVCSQVWQWPVTSESQRHEPQSRPSEMSAFARRP